MQDKDTTKEDGQEAAELENVTELKAKKKADAGSLKKKKSSQAEAVPVVPVTISNDDLMDGSDDDGVDDDDDGPAEVAISKSSKEVKNIVRSVAAKRNESAKRNQVPFALTPSKKSFDSDEDAEDDDAAENDADADALGSDDIEDGDEDADEDDEDDDKDDADMDGGVEASDEDAELDDETIEAGESDEEGGNAEDSDDVDSDDEARKRHDRMRYGVDNVCMCTLPCLFSTTRLRAHSICASCNIENLARLLWLLSKAEEKVQLM